MDGAWLVAGLSMVLAVAGWFAAARASRQARDLTAMYWQLKFEHGELKARVDRALPDPEAPPRLAGFARVEVASGDRRAFEILVPTDRLATRDTAARGWRSPTGIHRIVVGTFAGDPDATEVDVDLGA